MQTNCTALAKVTVNAKLKTLRIVFTFDLHNKVTVRNAAYVTGDICDKNDPQRDVYIARAVQQAKLHLRTNNVLVSED